MPAAPLHVSVWLRLALAALALLTAARPATAQPSAEPLPSQVMPPEDALQQAPPRVYVLTFGPGDHPFFKFGHNAIWVEPPSGGGLVYNFGTFAFDSPSLIPKFLLGRFHYWLSVSPIDETLWSYESSNRSIEAQELDLTPAQALDLQQRLQVNAQPDNRAYLYDYFYDNCSTRVRDAVDAGVGGLLKQALQAQPGRLTMRAHALRLTSDVHWEYVGLGLALSGRTDFLPNVWQESFIPQVFQRALRTVQVEGESGKRPLVKREFVMYPAPGRLPPAEVPPSRTSLFLLAGLACAGLLFFLTRAAHRNPAARVALGTTLMVLGLVAGIIGWFLLFVWVFTNHITSQANENILQAPFWMVALVVIGIGVARGKPASLRHAQKLFVAAALSSLLGLLLKVVPGFRQHNIDFILFFAPVWLAGAVGLRELRAAFVHRVVSKARPDSPAGTAAR